MFSSRNNGVYGPRLVGQTTVPWYKQVNLRGSVRTSLWAARFSECVLVELCVFREDAECAMGLFMEFLFPLVAASVDEALEDQEGCR
jgi:hypothetical protein